MMRCIIQARVREGIVLLLLAAAGLAPISAASAQAGPRDGGKLTVAVNGPITNTEIAGKHDDNTAMYLHHTMEGLVAYQDDMTVGPMLAESYEISNGGKTYTFELRRGLKFHNGEPVRAADVKWTWDHYRSADYDWGKDEHCREWFDGTAKISTLPTEITDVVVEDDHTVVFELASPSSTFLPDMANNYCVSGIIHKDSLSADGTWDRNIGTGPYMVKTWNDDGGVTLERFEDYVPRAGARNGFGGRKVAHFDEIRFRPIEDFAQARAALRSGEVDAIYYVPFEEREALAREKGIDVQVVQRPALQMLLLQTRDPVLQDVRLRRALAHAIDHDRLVEEVLGAGFEPNPSITAVGMPAHTTAHQQGLEYDVRKARKLLEDAGYEDEPIVIQASGDYVPMFVSTAKSVVGMWREAGINASLDEVDWPTQDVDLYENQYQVSSIAYSMRVDPALMYAVLVGKKSDRPSAMWQDMEAIVWSYQAALESDQRERQKLLDRLHRKMLKDVPLIPLFNSPVVSASRSEIKGFEPWTMGLGRYWGVWRD